MSEENENVQKIFFTIAIGILTGCIIYMFYKVEKFDTRKEDENPDYITGTYYLEVGEDGYAKYNDYKKDPSQQPINAPPVDYKNNPVSTLPKENKMYAVPDEDVYINLLNGRGRL